MTPPSSWDATVDGDAGDWSGSFVKYWLNVGFLEVAQLVPIVQAAERLGFEGAALPDHLFFPEHIESAYPYSSDGEISWSLDAPWPDCWVSIAALAQVTSRIRFTTGVFVAPLRDVFSLAKAIGTAAGFAPGRVSCGFGAGWMREEFDIVGQPFESRGPRLDEMIEALRLLWSGEPVSLDGDNVTFPPVRMRPAVGHVPVLIGGNTAPALRRAAHNDGWIGSYAGMDATAAMLERLSELRRGSTEDDPFEILLTATPGAARDAAALEASGVDGLVLPAIALARSTETEAVVDALERFAAERMKP